MVAYEVAYKNWSISERETKHADLDEHGIVTVRVLSRRSLCMSSCFVVAEGSPGPPEPTRSYTGDSRLWRMAAVLFFALWVIYLLVPREYIVLRASVLYLVGDLAAVCAVLCGIHLYRPRLPVAWFLIAAGLASFTVADFIYSLHQVAGTNPFPSTADIFYLLAYPLFAAGLHIATRARLPDGERGSFLDASIVTVTAGLFAALLIANQYVADPDLPVLDTIVASAYPLADVLLLAVALRLLLFISWRPRSLRVLGLSLIAILAGDVVYSARELFTTTGQTGTADALLLGGALLMGLAGLHPTMVELTLKARLSVTSYTERRVVALYLVSLVPVVVLGVQAVTAQAENVWITVVAMVAVAGLVTIRLVGLVKRSRLAADREATLSRLGSELLRSSTRDELFEAAERAAAEVVPDGGALVLGAGRVDDQEHVFRAPVEVGGQVVAEVVADEVLTARQGTRDALSSVARSLSLALERLELLASQQETAANLAAQNAQLVELDRMKDQLVSSVSHELRTPLTSIGGYTEMLLSGEFGDLNEDQQEFIEVVDRNVKKLNRLIDDILFASRVDAGRLSLERSWVNLTDVASSSVEGLLPGAQQGEVRLALDAAEGLPDLWADQTRLTQMIDNLLSNAIKFTPPGGEIRLTLSGTETGVHVEVTDTGMGIPVDEVEHLFERFFRSSTVGAVAGTGLGLSIVKSIVEVHDGAIAVTSTEGVGTTFHIDLPVQPQTPTRRTETEADE